MKRGNLAAPVIGVARSKLDLKRFQVRVRDSIAQDGGGIEDEQAPGRLISLLGYVSIDYSDPATLAMLRRAVGDATRQAYYLAILPSVFETVIAGLGGAGLADGARVIVEKPFGRDLASAKELNRFARSVFPEDSILRIDRYLAKEENMNLLYFGFANSFGADLEPQLRGQLPNHTARGLRRRGPRRVLRDRWLPARRDREPPFPGGCIARHGAADL